MTIGKLEQEYKHEDVKLEDQEFIKMEGREDVKMEAEEAERVERVPGLTDPALPLRLLESDSLLTQTLKKETMMLRRWDHR